MATMNWHPPDVDTLHKRWPQCTREELQKLADAFDKFDKDNSGTIDIGEFQYILAAAQGKTNAKVPLTQRCLSR